MRKVQPLPQRTNSMDMNLGKLQEMVRDRGSLAYYSPRGRKESDTTGGLNNCPEGACGPITIMMVVVDTEGELTVPGTALSTIC